MKITVMRRNTALLVAVCGFDVYTSGFRPLDPLRTSPAASCHAAADADRLVAFGIPDPFRGLYPPTAVLGAIGMLLMVLATLILVFSFVSACIVIHRQPI